MNDAPQTLTEAIRFFADEDTCLQFMIQLRWPNGVTCPTCGSGAVSFISTRRVWKCRNKHDRQQFSIKVGTVFEDSPISLTKWLPAIWLLTSCKNGISSYELHRALKVTQKTAWFMLHRIRLAMQSGTFEKLSGQVEVDETYIGGKARNMHKERKDRILQGKRGPAGKTIVVGLLERGDKKQKGKKQEKVSKVQATVVQDTKAETLQPEVRARIEKGSQVFTDEHGGYDGLNDDYTHEVINHAEAYVRDHVTTNGIENFWTLLKRTIKGTYVSCEPFHLHKYLDEQAFRFNERKGTDANRFITAASSIVGKRLTYKQLPGTNLIPSPT